MSGENSIFIRLDKPSYLPGEQVNGQVYVNIVEDTNGDTLYLMILGAEFTKYKTRHSSGSGKNRRTRTVTHIGQNDILKHEYTLMSSQTGKIERGQYCFPVSFVIPMNAPASFSYGSASTYSKINYSVQAYIPPTGFFGFFKSSLSFATPVEIRQLPVAEQGQKSGECTAKAVSCCCCNQGEVYIKAHFEKTNYTAGDIAIIITEVNASNLKADIPNLTAYLKRQIYLGVHSPTRNYDHHIFKVTLPGIRAGEQRMGSNAIRHEFKIETTFEGEPLQPTSLGKIAGCIYTLETSAFPSLTCGCCSQTPVVAVPIHIYNAQTHQAPQAPIPYGNNWAPQMMSPFVATFDERSIAKNKTDPNEQWQGNMLQPINF